jgi:hypothetical protein
MSQLLTFFSENDKGRRLVGIGITADMLKQLKKDGLALEAAERTGTNIDVVVLYDKKMDRLVERINDLAGGEDNVDVVEL